MRVGLRRFSFNYKFIVINVWNRQPTISHAIENQIYTNMEITEVTELLHYPLFSLGYRLYQTTTCFYRCHIRLLRYTELKFYEEVS